MLWNNFYKLRLCGDIKCIINHVLLKQVSIIEQDSKENDHFMAYLSLILFLTCIIIYLKCFICYVFQYTTISDQLSFITCNIGH